MSVIKYSTAVLMLSKCYHTIYNIIYSDEDEDDFYLDAEGSVARISHSNDKIPADTILKVLRTNNESAKEKLKPK